MTHFDFLPFVTLYVSTDVWCMSEIFSTILNMVLFINQLKRGIFFWIPYWSKSDWCATCIMYLVPQHIKLLFVCSVWNHILYYNWLWRPVWLVIQKMRCLYLKYIIIREGDSRLMTFFEPQLNQRSKGNWASTCLDDLNQLRKLNPWRKLETWIKTSMLIYWTKEWMKMHWFICWISRKVNKNKVNIQR